MSRKSFILSAFLIAVLGRSQATAADFFSTAEPEKIFNLGVRVGVNTSNRTVGNNIFNHWNSNSWGTGFDAGVVADINIRDYISIQPGFFYQSRSGGFTYSDMLYMIDKDALVHTQFGHMRSYYFNIPILASVRFNVSDDVRWSVDFGPYMGLRLGSSFSPEVMYIDQSVYGESYSYSRAKLRSFDVGFKMGMGLNIMRNYYFGIHYMAGATDVWKTPFMKGRNKAWTFTVGYDF